jgi:hypothetical protein
MKTNTLLPIDAIEQKILLIRGQKVMLDRDLAELYNVETKYLNRQVKRNRGRFPEEFMFQLTTWEKNELVTNWHRLALLKHSTSLPYAFTEHGVAMLASVLNSAQAVRMSLIIVKTFVRMREIVSTHKELIQKLKLLEMRIDRHDESIQSIMEAIRQLVSTPEKPKRRIGFI